MFHVRRRRKRLRRRRPRSWSKKHFRVILLWKGFDFLDSRPQTPAHHVRLHSDWRGACGSLCRALSGALRKEFLPPALSWRHTPDQSTREFVTMLKLSEEARVRYI